MNDPIYPQPDVRLMLAEGPRVVAEFASLLPVAPFLCRAPRGDGHPLLVMPGFGASDRSTVVLRGFLTSLGYLAHPWNLGTNRGAEMPDLLAELSRRLEAVFAESGDRKVSLIGWSLGGVYARILAHHYPEKVRQVITLGSPFAGNPRSTSVHRFMPKTNDIPLEQRPTNPLRLLAGQPLPGTPSSAVFSKTDGIVPWQIATQQPSRIAENIEVYASHIGLGLSPAVLYVTADRLAQPDREWQPFLRQGWKRLVYGTARLDAGGPPLSHPEMNAARAH